MNKELWNKILEFDFDDSESEYSFKTRLAKENYWTINFTEKAILEYKKFMYLATISNSMVSPSETVDQVWHQHLIFTTSYNKFCKILGKYVQHIPSTNNKTDFEKFKLAKKHTKTLYENEFNKQPKDIWKFNNMYESLNLQKSQLKTRSFINFGMVIFVCVTFPAFFLLNPIYTKIESSLFITILIFLSVFIFTSLNLFNNYSLKKIIKEFDETSFIKELKPLEVIYLKKQSLNDAINVVINELIKNKVIEIVDKNKIILINPKNIQTNKQFQIIKLLSENEPIEYSKIQNKLNSKPVFQNIKNSMDAFRKYFNKSKKFNTLIYINFITLAFLVLLAFTRIITGLANNKPIIFILILTIVLVTISLNFLNKLSKEISVKIIPNLYINEILPSKKVENNSQWSYFLFGTSVLTASFASLIIELHNRNMQDKNSGNSCGNSCGSSCGGCGGCGS